MTGADKDAGQNAGRPWFAAEAAAAAGDARRHAPATLRNRAAIAEKLATELPESGLVLEVASGSGEHIIHFARLFPALDWQPSDPDATARASIAAWRAQAGLANIRPPLALDASAGAWPPSLAAVLCINMAHISPWEASLGLFAGAGRALLPGAPLLVYGPFERAGVETAPSNRAFDADLRARDARYGLRRVEDMDRAAQGEGLVRTALHAMPANNLMLVYRKAPVAGAAATAPSPASGR